MRGFAQNGFLTLYLSECLIVQRMLLEAVQEPLEVTEKSQKNKFRTYRPLTQNLNFEVFFFGKGKCDVLLKKVSSVFFSTSA